MIALADVVLRHDLDPRLGDRDDGLIEQYAEIFDALPPIEINQHNEVIDGWHRVLAAKHADRTEIACVVVETKDDDDLADITWERNLKHGAQYSREQRKTRGLKLHERGKQPKEIADRIGVSAATVRRWTKDLRERDKQQRNEAVIELAEQGKTQAEIAEETGVPQRTVSDILSENVQMREIAKDVVDEEPQPEEPAPELEAPSEESREEPQPEPEMDDVPAEEEPETLEPEPPPEEPAPEPESELEPELPPIEDQLEIESEPEAEAQLEEPELPEDIFAFTAPLGFLGTLSVRWQSAVKSRLRDKHRRGNEETSD